MSRKSKGINAERDLIHKFWNCGWAAHRIAGSGSSKYPSSDIIAANKLRRLAIECKTCKDSRKYLSQEDVGQLKEFSDIFGAEPWFGIKFDKKEWLFFSLEDIQRSGESYVVTLELGEAKGLLLEELLEIKKN